MSKILHQRRLDGRVSGRASPAPTRDTAPSRKRPTLSTKFSAAGGDPPDLAAKVLAGKIKYAEVERPMGVERDVRFAPDPELPQEPDGEYPDTQATEGEVAPETPVPEPEPTPPTPPTQDPTDRPDRLDLAPLQCLNCPEGGAPLKRGKAGRPPTLCLPCRRRGQSQRRLRP